VNGNDDNLRSLRARRLDVEQGHRDFERAKYAERQSRDALAGRVPDYDDTTGERVSLMVRLAEWADKHPELAAEVANFERMTA